LHLDYISADKPTDKNEYEKLTLYIGKYPDYWWMLLDFHSGATSLIGSAEHEQ
jgi:hypothetical protein